MILLSDTDIKRIYSLNDCFSAVTNAFKLFSSGKVDVPVRTQISKELNSGTFLCMPAFCDAYNASCVKVLNMFPENVKSGLSSINAKILNIDTDTGVINAIFDGNYITKLRTAAATGIAIKTFAKSNCKNATLIGAGGQAYTQAQAIMLSKPFQRIQIADLNYNRAKSLADKINSDSQNSATEIVATNDLDQSIADADVIVTDTTATSPVFNGSLVKPGTTICGIGSYKPTMQEIPSEVIARASRIYFDSQEAVLSESGDILRPLHEGLISDASFTGDIGDVLNGKISGRKDDSQIIFFKTVGIAAQDLITTKSIYDKATKMNVGQVIN